MPLETFRNPVHPRHFADPFVLRSGDTWYAWGTGPEGDALSARHGARVFEARRSPDFATWVSAGYALVPPALPAEDEDGPGDREFWSPEVTEIDGRFHLYYSTGIADRRHHLRVATADRPDGPFEDAGVNLTPDEAFATDPHPFRDDDGQWYLYYARHHLPGRRPGSALAVDRLVEPARLGGTAQVVLEPAHDWQLASRGRVVGGTAYDWYALEAPFVRKRAGRYWCLYSGGGATGAQHGVSYAVADRPLGPFTEPAPGAPQLLRSIPGFRGPGHCSIAEGPDGDDWLVYDAWDDAATARRMCLDRITWTPEGPRTDGPTAAPQPVPSPSDRRA